MTTAGAGRRRFLSIGSGNCDLEVRLASGLKGAGPCNLVIDCLDINEDMLERGRIVLPMEKSDAPMYGRLHFPCRVQVNSKIGVGKIVAGAEIS